METFEYSDLLLLDVDLLLQLDFLLFVILFEFLQLLLSIFQISEHFIQLPDLLVQPIQ